MIQNRDSFDDYINSTKSWYAEKYIQPYVFRFKFLLNFILLAYGGLVLNGIINTTSYIITLPFPLYVEHDDDESYHINSIASREHNMNVSIATYMLKRYIHLREEYDPSVLHNMKWEMLMRNVQAMSSHSIFSEYISDIIPYQNPKSPILAYKFYTFVNVKINNISILPSKALIPNKAIIHFTTNECKNDATICQSKDLYAEVSFEMDNAYAMLDNQQHDTFKFKVFKYIVKQQKVVILN